MNRFIWIGNEYLNTDYIVSVSSPQPDDTIFIELSDGRTLTRSSKYLKELVGHIAHDTPTTA